MLSFDAPNIIALILTIIAFIGLSWFAGSDAPYIPTKHDPIKKILKASGLKKGDTFYELGSGDGRVVYQAALLGADATGIEQSWIRVWQSRFRAHKLRLKNAEFMHGNIFSRHYYPGDIVYIYLLRPAVARLETKLKDELKKGAVVITQTYHFPNWKPYKSIGQFNFYRV